uniref:Protein NYNRIN-like n=1 Tax=Nicotiana tabacum TaxID=4097 RepID=A0A1S4BVX4_TOBAC|nr:PREDICTED: uncharacterized protein LOC107812443 [Nicotiana tabacum]
MDYQSQKGKIIILVVVDRFTKYGHFIAISHPYTATSIAQVFLDNIFKLHGMPENIVNSQQDWALYLPLAEWWYNFTFHSAIQTTPYEALYGQPTPIHLPYLAGEATYEEIDKSLIREFKTQLLRTSGDIGKKNDQKGEQGCCSIAKEQATWEDYHVLKTTFPTFFLEDKEGFKRGEMMQNQAEN